jgi:hypothetical protein
MLAGRTGSFARAAALLAIALSAIAGSGGQAAPVLSQVRKLYVDSLGSDGKAAGMRARLVERLRRDHALEIAGLFQFHYLIEIEKAGASPGPTRRARRHRITRNSANQRDGCPTRRLLT